MSEEDVLLTAGAVVTAGVLPGVAAAVLVVEVVAVDVLATATCTIAKTARALQVRSIVSC